MKQQEHNKSELKGVDFVAWRVMQGKKCLAAEKTRREYNQRARLRRETRH